MPAKSPKYHIAPSSQPQEHLPTSVADNIVQDTSGYQPNSIHHGEGPGIRRASASSSVNWSDIILQTTFVVLPMTVFPVVLVAVIYTHQLTQGAVRKGEGGALVAHNGNNVYTNYNSTTLVFIASWSSTVALALVGSIMTLYSYCVARSLLRHHGGASPALPTAYHLYLMVGILAGTMKTLLDWLLYVVRGRKGRAAAAPILGRAAGLMGAVIALGLLIQAADTWLHIATKTVEYTQSRTRLPEHFFSRGISEETRTWLSNSSTVNQGTGSLIARYNNQITEDTLQVLLRNSSTAYQTAEGRSRDHATATHQIASSNRTFAYLVEKSPPPDIDYSASTVGASTFCVPVKTRYGGSDPCPTFPFSFRGHSPSAEGMRFNLFNDSAPLFGNYSSYTAPTNPFTWGFYAYIDGWDHPGDGFGVGENPFLYDMNVIISSSTSPSLFVQMYCNTTVYDVQYSISNGSVDSFQYTESNNTLSAMIGGPMFPVSSNSSDSDSDPSPTSSNAPWLGFGRDIMNINLRAATSGKTSFDIANSWSTAFSRAAVASATGVMERRINTDESVRTTVLAAALPKAPLYTLITLDLLYAILGIMLAAIAVAASSSNRGLRETQEVLTMSGLVAQAFRECPLEGKER